eukprot:scaffold10644_cov107-Isochrysis_galbana.AAC.5
MPKNCLKKTRKMYELEKASTSTARNVENAPWMTAVPISVMAARMRSSCVPLAATNAWATWAE